MKISTKGFGLLSLLISIALIGTLFVLSIQYTNRSIPAQEEGETIFDSIDDAEEISDLLEGNQQSIQDQILQ